MSNPSSVQERAPPIDEGAAPAASPTILPPPRNPLVCALLTDLYQITMVYAYWKNNRHNETAVFELFFRKHPFQGEYTVFAGLEECVKFLKHFRFSADDVQYLRNGVPSLQHCEDTFWEYLENLDASHVELWALPEGSLAFPRVPLLVVEAPLAIGQLLETTFLTLVNYPSLVATNAARMVRAARAKPLVPVPHGDGEAPLLPAQCSKIPACIEFGLRRAQGPDGGVSASHYAHLGGFDATSNVLAGKLSGVPLSGTHAHAFVQSFASLDEVQDARLDANTGGGGGVMLRPCIEERRRELAERFDPAFARTHDGELAAFVAYASAFPHHFLGLIDTYDTLRSGLLNFLVVATVMLDHGGTPLGVRLDSGDLAHLSLACAGYFECLSEDWPACKDLSIVASNDLDEEALHKLNAQGPHAITAYGIGTNLVTCESQPALGCVYKLVEICGRPRLKLSQDPGKATIPSCKRAYRLYGGPDGQETPLLDLLAGRDEASPEAGERVLCLHPSDERKRVYVTPRRVEPLLQCVFRGEGTPSSGIATAHPRSLLEARQAVSDALEVLPDEVARFQAPRPYKVSVTPQLYRTLHNLWLQESPVPELS